MNHSKLSVRTLTMLALLTAMSIIFARVLTVSTGFLRFNLGALPTHLAAVWFGPAGGFAVGAVADLIGGTLSGYSINPLITLGAGSVGLVSGLCSRSSAVCGWDCGSRSAYWPGIWWARWSSTRWRSTFFMDTSGRCWRPASPTPSC